MACGFPPPKIRPIFRSRAEPSPNRIQLNVAALGHGFFHRPQPVVEKVPLPDDARMLGGPGFERRDALLQVEVVGEADQGVEVVRHGDEQPGGPVAEFVVFEKGLKQALPSLREGKLVLVTGLTANRQEPSLLGRIEPMRRIVRETLADGTGGSWGRSALRR